MRVDLHEKLMFLIEEVIDGLVEGSSSEVNLDIDGSAIRICGYVDFDDDVVCLELYGLLGD